jgi:nucleoside-diphosphate-sugar epimerase
MILLEPERGDAAGMAVAIFGTGLLGFSIFEALQARAPRHARELPLHWEMAEARPRQLRIIEDDIRRHLQSGARLSVLWTAGRAGFLSNEAETALELQSFSEVLAMTERLAREYPRTSFHLVSSAGGLFEGQRHVILQSPPRPRRPYGYLKLRQEELLQAATAPLTRRIYRVTSAYGFARPRFRTGLVATLILDGIRRTVTQITGMMDTLRDFVFIGDVASFIAARLIADAGDDAADDAPTVFLARGRPCSLFEVQHLVEQAIGRKLHVSYSASAENAEDITFAPDIGPPRWWPSDIRANIGMIVRDAISHGAPAAPFAHVEGAH